MKIYTRTGDAGDTALFGGGRVSKDHPRVAAYGTVDELNASIGWAVATVADADIREHLAQIQHDLFALGAILASASPLEGRPRPKGVPEVPGARVPEMEGWMDGADDELPPLRAFILPGGTQGAAALHLARTVCRRAERAVVHLATLGAVEEGLVVYLNRLSDLLFTFARLENRRAGAGDVEWRKV
ncbi:MAG TPA: cob(I)yrinic acid a,c-diamide adenosyltransferase [Longimicrobiales bacterium]|nr:cob(I)yrinic acid a,c-diamide adenosyltransferase [Longimicrobiales bacterium]